MSNGISIIGENRFFPDVAWHEIGAVGEPAFGTNWANFAGGVYSSMAFRMDSEGWVHMKGLAANGVNAMGAGGTIFTLPFGYRPSRMYYAPAIVGGSLAGYIRVSTTGVVDVFSDAAGASNGFISFEGVRFPCAAIPASDLEFYPLEVTSTRVIAPYTDWPMSLWKRKTGMVEVMGLQGACAAGQVAKVMAIAPNEISTMFPFVDASTNTKPAEVDSGYGFYIPVTTATYTIVHSEFGLANIENKWTTMAMSNSWVPYGYTTTGRWVGASFWKDPDGFVHLRGLVKTGSSATATIATLPSGYRPAKTSLFLTQSALGTGACRIDITNAGVISAQAGGSTTYTSLGGICFYADQ